MLFSIAQLDAYCNKHDDENRRKSALRRHHRSGWLSALKRAACANDHQRDSSATLNAFIDGEKRHVDDITRDGATATS